MIRKLAINYRVENNDQYEIVHDNIYKYCVNLDEIAFNWLHVNAVTVTVTCNARPLDPSYSISLTALTFGIKNLSRIKNIIT